MTDLTKYNGEKCILDHIELHIEDKDKVGILGVNGTGKSTLLKIIAGVEDYQGKMSYQKELRGWIWILQVWNCLMISTWLIC